MKSIINLVQTSQGYSIVQNGVQVNKSTGKSKEKPYSLNKKLIQQTYTIYPYIPSLEGEAHKYLLLPARTLWFNLNFVHQIQKKALPEWFKIKKGILASMNNIKFEKHEELYRKYRNHIIEYGKKKYITPSDSRKGLAGDACAIIRIHKFLEKWGIINYVHKKPGKTQEERSPQQKEPIKVEDVPRRKDCFDRDKLIAPRSYSKDDLELLKKVTKKFRPACHFCEGICGVSWYEFKDKLHIPKFVEKEGRRGKVLQNTQDSANYSMVLCTSCFFEGSYPLILTSSDFVKQTVHDNLLEDIASIQKQRDKKRKDLQNKVAESMEKHRFKIKKTAEQVKLPPQQVFRILLTMPIQKLQKISRIEPETDDVEPEEKKGKQKIIEEEKVEKQTSKPEQRAKILRLQFQAEVQMLQHEERKAYEQFFQSWFQKIHIKLQRLKEWEEGVQTKFEGITRIQKNLMASKVQACSKYLDL